MIVTATLKSTGQKISAELKEKKKCFCNRDFTAEDLKNIISSVRKDSNVIYQTQYIKNLDKNIEIADFHTKTEGYKNNPIYIYKNKKVIKYRDNNKKDVYFCLEKGVPISIDNDEKPKLWMVEKNDYTDFQDNLFQNNIKDKFLLNPLSYEIFAIYLNQVFNTYNIKTCLQRVHFLAQCYVETFRFTKIYEDKPSGNYQGGEIFRGRGFIHLTHDYNYLEYYDKIHQTNLFYSYTKNRTHKVVNGKIIYETISEFNTRTKNEYISKEDMRNLSFFATKISTDIFFVIDSAGWYWQTRKINQCANEDNIEIVTQVITGSPNQAFDDRKKYTEKFKKVFDYENCVNKK